MAESVEQLQHLIASFRDERDWRKFHRLKDLAMAISIEAAELQELFLWASEEDSENLLRDKEGREKVSDELADVFAYVLAFADRAEIDLASALKEKMQKNSAKYPAELVRGSSKKYTLYEQSEE